MLQVIEACPGLYLRTRGCSAGLCYSCLRHGLAGPQIKPAAFMDGNNDWDCPNRLTAHSTTPAASSSTSFPISRSTA